MTLVGGAQAAPRADLDGDKVLDTLEPAMSGTAPRAVIVALRVPATEARVTELEHAVGDLDVGVRLQLVEAFTARATPEQIRALALRPEVAHIEDDAVAVPFAVSAQTFAGIARAREDLPGLAGEGTVAAIIDSGIDTTMPDLPRAKVIGFKDFVKDAGEPYDDLPHGSLVAGLLAGTGKSGPEGRGVAPEAKLVGIKVVDSNAQSSLSKIAQGIEWAVQHRAEYSIDVINLSIGDPVGCGGGVDVASQAVDAATAAGIVVVAAAGNAGPGPCSIKAPGSAASALTVGAVADPGAGGVSLAWFSSRGPTADGRVKPDVVAPGVNVRMAVPWSAEPVAQSGTSAAAPIVAGAALLLLQSDPTLTPAQVKAAFTRTAVDLGAPGRDSDYGFGRLDFYAALRGVGAPLAVPPAVPDQATWSGTLAEGESATHAVAIAGDRFPLAATLTGPGAGFDLALLDADGRAVGIATEQFGGPSRQEDISLAQPAAATYTVRVTARSGAGDFRVDLAGALAPADTTPPALTLDAGRIGGDAGTALGDFPAVVLRVLRDGAVIRRLADTPLLGRWTLAPGLPDGDYTLEAEQGDAAGNVAHVTRALHVDTVAPSAPAVDPVAPWQRTSAVTLTGSAEPGARIGTATVGEDGRWTLRLENLAEGEHRLMLTVTDAAGNVSPAVTVTVRVDTVAPAVTIDADLHVTTSEGALQCRLDGDAWGACTEYGGLPAGSHALDARATDAAGNVSVLAHREWTVPAPTATATATPNATVAATPTPTPAATASPRPAQPTPELSLTVPKQRLATVLKRGLTVRATCSSGCRMTVTITQGKQVVARGTSATLKLTAAARKALAKARRITLKVTVAAPGATTVTRTVTLSR
ncbi:S8 family serine peptidase [Solirubrobacter taibaiensis]|nr:S8 family serine peptidase [Solirubrobacter taibaiensis]